MAGCRGSRFWGCFPFFSGSCRRQPPSTPPQPVQPAIFMSERSVVDDDNITLPLLTPARSPASRVMLKAVFGGALTGASVLGGGALLILRFVDHNDFVSSVAARLGMTPSEAKSFIYGMVVLSGSALGMLVGGLVARRFNMRAATDVEDASSDTRAAGTGTPVYAWLPSSPAGTRSNSR